MNLLPLMIAVPLGVGFVMALMPKRREDLADALAIVTTLALVVMGVVLAGEEGMYRVGGWVPPLGINLFLDGLSRLMLLTVAVISFAATLFSTRYMNRYTGRTRYYSLFMLMIAGMNGAVLTGDMFNLYVFIEIAAISSYALVAFGCQQEELEAAFKYAVLGSIASACVLLGVAMLYCQLGTVNMGHLGSKIGGAGGGGPVVMFSLGLFVAGLGLKAAVVPFHAWLPDAHPSAPAPISAMLSGVLIKAIGVYALIRVAFNVFGITTELAKALMVLGTLSMVVGVFMAIVQWDYKRLLAYHSVSQIGYVMLGIGVGGAVLAAGGSPAVAALGFIGGLFHLVNHAAFKSLLFLTAGAVEYSTGTRQLKQMGGLGRRMPVTAGTSLAASMAIAGVPPFNGFFSKLIIIVACVKAGYCGFAAWAVLVSVITLASFMKVQKYAFFGRLPERWKRLREVPAPMGIAMVLLALLCLGMSLLTVPRFRTEVLDPAAQVLADKHGYVTRVVGKIEPGVAARSPEIKVAER